RTVIDDLERLARLTLADTTGERASPPSAEAAAARADGPDPGSGAPEAVPLRAAARGSAPPAGGALVVESIEAVRRELAAANPEVAFVLRAPGELGALRVPLAPTPFHEVLTILLRNA